MLGMFDYHIQGVDTKSYYKDLADKLDKCVEENTCYKTLFNFYKYFALVLSEKADLGIHLKEAYDKKDLSTLEELNTKSYPQYSGEFTTYAPIPRGIMDEGCKAFWLRAYGY